MNYKQYIEKMNGFKNENWVRNQLQLAKKPNFWSILEYGEGTEYSAHEIRTSRMIRWLMDANETHQVGNLFAQKLISKMGGDYEFNPQKNKEIEATAEYKHIDVFYRDLEQHVCVAIEVKQHAKEGISSNNESQLDNYEKIVEDWKQKLDQSIKAYYIFLTPLGTDATNENWKAMGYEAFIQVIDEFIVELQGINPPNKLDTFKIVVDFREDLQRTLDFQRKDHQEIYNKLTDEEKRLTLEIAGGEIIDAFELELQHQGIEQSEFFEFVQLVEKYLYAQNHTPNKEVHLLMRKIYNYFAEQSIDTNQQNLLGKKGHIASIKPTIISQYNLNFTKVSLTSGKGQGLFLNSETDEKRIYLSGDTYGNFPNDGIQLITYENESKSIVRSKQVKRNTFVIEGETYKINVKESQGKIVNFEYLMEQVLKAIQELNNL